MDSGLSKNSTKLTKASPSGECTVVTVELAAAEALTGLAHYSSLSEQVESTVVGPRTTNPNDSFTQQRDIYHERAVVLQEQCDKQVQVEQEAELSKRSIACTQSNESSGCNKSRQNWNEAEKEAQRLRRVLANRESARQTIRRRQAIYEELTRKVADLAHANENLKREKKLAAKEYNSLKSINEYLRSKMAEVVKAETDKCQEELKTNHVEPPSFTSTNGPFFIYSQPPFPPFFWPSVAHSSDSLQFQCGRQNGTGTPPQVPMPAIGESDSHHDQKSSMMFNNLGTPLYLSPCPWFFPIPCDASRLHSQPFGRNNKQNETYVNNQCGSSTSSKVATNLDNHPSLIPIKVKTEASKPIASVPVTNLHESALGFPTDGPQSTVLMPELTCVRSAVHVQDENISIPDCMVTLKAISSMTSQTVNALPQNNEEPSISQSEKLVYAAAEARKRRKKLTKLKKLHCRRF